MALEAGLATTTTREACSPDASAVRRRSACGRLPEDDARLLSEGASSLSTQDLLGRVLAAGAPGPRAEALARALLDRVGGLRPLAAQSAEELAELPGLRGAPLARLIAAVELGRRLSVEPWIRGVPLRASADVFRHFHPVLRDLRVEQFRVVLLDGKHRVIRDELVSQGTLTSAPVHPREVFAAAIRCHAASVILVHNHPSGDPTPSPDDLEITRRLCDVGELVGVRVVDHVVIGDGAFASFADRGILPS